jgi:hypothetical protein
MSYSTPVPTITYCLTRSFGFAGNEILFAFETFRCRMGESVFARDERSDSPSERSALVRLCKSADLKLRGQRPANCPQRRRRFRLENIVASWRAHLHRHRSRPTRGTQCGHVAVSDVLLSRAADPTRLGRQRRLPSSAAAESRSAEDRVKSRSQNRHSTRQQPRRDGSARSAASYAGALAILPGAACRTAPPILPRMTASPSRG